jgi:hypothetical protein
MEEFSYLKKSKTNSLFEKYNEDEIIMNNWILIQSSKNLKYLLFKERESFLEYMNGLNDEDRHYNEIILENDLQKFRIDIDYNTNNEEIMSFINNFIKLIIIKFNKLLKKKISIEIKYYLFDSSIPEKISKHIIFNVYFKNSFQCKKFAIELNNLLIKSKSSLINNDIIKKYNIDISKIMDMSVYKTLQAFRLPFNIKFGKNNLKKCINYEKISIFDAMIKGYKPLDKYNKNIDIILDNIYEDEKKNINDINEFSKDIDDKLIKKIIDMSKEYLENMEYREIITNKIIFNRKKSGFCKLCERLHDNENNIYIVILQNKFKIFCRRNDEKFIEFDLKNEDYNLLINKKKYIETIINDKNIIVPDDPLLKYFNKTNLEIYKENKMLDYNFEDKKILFVKGNMKLGKTKALKKYLDMNPKIENIIFISFRVLFTMDVNNNFKDFKNYLLLNKEKISIKKHKKIIIQIESLHRLSLDELPDLLILDESESILGQFNSPNIKGIRTAWEIFEFLLRVSKKIICMDANLGERTLNIIKKIHPIENIKLHYNTYSTLKNDEYIFIPYFNIFLDKLDETIKKNKRIVIPTNSLKKAKIIYDYITSNYKDKNIILYSSETDDHIKKKDLSNVNQNWCNYDILIYTPCITAGISFEMTHFDVLFGCFTNRSCDVMTLLQMLFRVRRLNDNKIYLFIEIFNVNELVPYNKDSIEESIKYSLKYLINECLSYKIEYKLDSMEIQNKFDKDDTYYTLWFENKKIYFDSMLNFYKSLIIILRRNDCKLISFNDNKLKRLNIDVAKIANMIDYKDNENIFNAKNIDEIEAEELKNKIDLTEEEKLSEKKNNLKQLYNIEYDDIDMEFLITYNKSEVKRNFINLCKVKNFTINFNDFYSSIIKNVFYDNNINNIQAINILSINELIMIKKIIDIIEYLDLDIYDINKKIDELTIKDNINKNFEYITKNIKFINEKTNIIISKKNIITIINRILDNVWGYYINRKKMSYGGHEWYFLERNPLFNDEYPIKLNNAIKE